jgi:DNA polymerase III gamma/tau subunit
VVRDLPSSPFSLKYKVIIFDEAHKLTPAAQDLLLKVIEDGYHHVYFIFCTNKPEKLTEAFVSRCNVMHFGRISQDLLLDMLKNVAEFEAMEYNPEVLDYVATEARGVPRDALVYLKQANDEGSWVLENVKEVVGIALDEESPQIVEISKALLKCDFNGAVKLYDKIKKKTQAESVRIGIAAYLVGCLKRARGSQGADKFSRALDIVTVPIYEQGRPGDYKLYNYLYKISRTLR